MAMELLKLPTEVLEHISSFLDARSLTKLGQTCKALNNVSNVDRIWQSLCYDDYGVAHNTDWELTFKKIYTKILYPYPILGFKRLALRPYGGLLHIMWIESEIKVRRFYPRRTVDLELMVEPAFSIYWNEDDELEVTCEHDPEDPAIATILKDGSRCIIQCGMSNCDLNHPRSKRYLGQNNRKIPDSFSGAFSSFKFNEGYSCPLLPIDFRPTPSHFPVTPGFYRGDYGGHGVEIIQVMINESNPYLLEGLKITGDANVPAGHVSIMAYLDKPLRLTEEEQQNTQEMAKADEKRSEEEYKNLLSDKSENWRQAFVLPTDCVDRGAKTPSTCLARYIGHGRIAGHFFSSPSLCPIHMVVFDKDTIGIIWLGLSCFMMMQRETDILGGVDNCEDNVEKGRNKKYRKADSDDSDYDDEED